MNLFERINSKLEELTPSQTEVATYTLKNKEEILYINAKEVLIIQRFPRYRRTSHFPKFNVCAYV